MILLIFIRIIFCKVVFMYCKPPGRAPPPGVTGRLKILLMMMKISLKCLTVNDKQNIDRSNPIRHAQNIIKN